ncbi:hypothetical protein ILYODFUR_036360, partial [Ilyodon furcidens]
MAALTFVHKTVFNSQRCTHILCFTNKFTLQQKRPNVRRPVYAIAIRSNALKYTSTSVSLNGGTRVIFVLISNVEGVEERDLTAKLLPLSPSPEKVKVGKL